MRISLVLIDLYIILSPVFLSYENDGFTEIGSTVFGLLKDSKSESL